MIARSRGLFFGLAVAGVGFLLNSATAQLCPPGCPGGGGMMAAPVVKITKTNFVAANGATPPKADPQGTWGKPAKDGVDWKVSWDYGTGTGPDYKDFKSDGTIGIGGDTKTLPDAGASGTWGGTGAENLKNPLPANTVIRVRLRRLENGQWVQKAVDYAPIP